VGARQITSRGYGVIQGDGNARGDIEMDGRPGDAEAQRMSSSPERRVAVLILGCALLAYVAVGVAAYELFVLLR
jgi:hypothetical protein